MNNATEKNKEQKNHFWNYNNNTLNYFGYYLLFTQQYKGSNQP